MVAQSDVTVIFSRWLTTSLFMPLGPREVETMRESSFAAEMLRSVAASRPSRDWWPSLSMPERPAAVLSAIDVMIEIIEECCFWFGVGGWGCLLLCF